MSPLPSRGTASVTQKRQAPAGCVQGRRVLLTVHSPCRISRRAQPVAVQCLRSAAAIVTCVWMWCLELPLEKRDLPNSGYLALCAF